jgi:hypothetical protein
LTEVAAVNARRSEIFGGAELRRGIVHGPER